MIEKSHIRFAAPADINFLRQGSHIAAHILQRKVEWQEIIIAESNSRLNGSLRIEYLWSSVPYIALIYVLREYQRQGVGKAMLHYLEAFLCDNGHSTLYSSSQVNEAEPQAWHRHMGFEECGVIAGINKGIGEVFFRKSLL
ncbi:MAG: GNAT family N-acetyltransferase [Pyrinomonadaceae bacterium]